VTAKGIDLTPWQQRMVDVVGAVLAEADSTASFEGRVPGTPDLADLQRAMGAGSELATPTMGRTTVAVELIRMIVKWDPSLQRPEVRRGLLRQVADER
jgi:hypothetical protein